MNKKLMAVAVAGALAAPAVVMAQSTVQVYGNIYMEYAYTNTGSASNLYDSVNADIFQTGGSELGFKGEEKLGGGMSAWFQCASTIDLRGQSADGWCARNSAIGLKGGFGNLYVGNWDTPFKKSMETVGGRDTGVFGTAFVLFGNSTTYADGAGTGAFKHRQNNSINYDSPRWSGFGFSLSTTSINASTSKTSTQANDKARLYSASADYKQGGLSVFGAYELHEKFYAFGGDESGWHIGASYTFGDSMVKGLKIGGLWSSMEADTAVGASADVDVWHIGLEWKFSGPHGIAASYSEADDMGGTTGAAMGLRPVVNAAGSTGAKLWQIRYLYDFSKRTQAQIGYVELKNDSNASYDLGGLSYAAAATGAKQKAFAVSIGHKF